MYSLTLWKLTSLHGNTFQKDFNKFDVSKISKTQLWWGRSQSVLFFFIVSTKQPFLSLIDGIFSPFHSWNTMLSHPHDWNSKNVPFLIFAGISSRSAVTSLKARLCLKRSAMTTKYSHYGMAKLSQKSIRWIRHGLSESSIGPTVQMCTQIITPCSFSANIKC